MPTNIHYVVPWGSALRPLIYNLNTAHIIRIAVFYGIHVHCYADDIQLFLVVLMIPLLLLLAC